VIRSRRRGRRRGGGAGGEGGGRKGRKGERRKVCFRGEIQEQEDARTWMKKEKQ